MIMMSLDATNGSFIEYLSVIIPKYTIEYIDVIVHKPQLQQQQQYMLIKN